MPVQSDFGSDQARFVCYTFDYPAEHVLTLPVPDETDDSSKMGGAGVIGAAPIWFQGSVVYARYERKGLTHLWWLWDDIFIKLDPDNVASYMDFRGAEEGEKRKPEAEFECKKRG
jgi:hypothetical protein